MTMVYSGVASSACLMLPPGSRPFGMFTIWYSEISASAVEPNARVLMMIGLLIWIDDASAVSRNAHAEIARELLAISCRKIDTR